VLTDKEVEKLLKSVKVKQFVYFKTYYFWGSLHITGATILSKKMPIAAKWLQRNP
jgi:hypothetical protein